MTLFDLITLAWKRRFLIVGSSMLFGAGAVAAALMATPIYRAEALLLPVQREGSGGALSSLVGQFGGLASLAGISMSTGDQTAEAVAVLQSRSLTEQFVSELDLLPVLFDGQWDSEENDWKALEDPPSMGDALRLFDMQIRSVRRDFESGLVTLQIDWKDRILAAEWANDLVRRANEALRQRAIDEADRSLEHLAKALDDASNVELRAAISSLIQSQLQMKTFASVRPDFAFRVVDPAIPPDADNRVSPRRTIMVLAGLFAGGLFGICLAAFLEYLNREAPVS